MEQTDLVKKDTETEDAFLYRLGKRKDKKEILLTWEQLAEILNSQSLNSLSFDESYWRKRYHRIDKALSAQNTILQTEENLSEETKRSIDEIEKQRVRLRDERYAYTRNLRARARTELNWQLLRDTIQRVAPTTEPRDTVVEEAVTQDEPDDKALYVMLSDIHYGLAFKTSYGEYSPKIAEERILLYANKIIDIGLRNNAHTVYLSLMGDLVSGGIHTGIRIENKENVIEQTINVSRAVERFIYLLTQSFDHLYVSSVSGNHSRIKDNLDFDLRKERLDAIVPWYCETSFEKIKNVTFVANEIDDTIIAQDIYGKTYVAVHGDFDPDLKVSANRISDLIGKRVDYLLAGHMHVADMRFENVGYIRNGSIVTGGDDYTSKKRLFAPAMQNVLLVSNSGVDAIFPVKLS